MGRDGLEVAFGVEFELFFKSQIINLQDKGLKFQHITHFAALSGTKTKMAGSWRYGEILLQFWAHWNRNNLWSINTLLYGPAEDFRRSAEGFVDQPAQKTSFWWKSAESRRNVPKGAEMYRKCTENFINRIYEVKPFQW